MALLVETWKAKFESGIGILFERKDVRRIAVAVVSIAFVIFSVKCIRRGINVTDSYIFYKAGRAVIEGVNLYDIHAWRGFKNPPFFAIFMVPFSLTGLAGFSVIWYFFNVALLVATFLLSFYLIEGRVRRVPAMMVLLPLAMTLRPIESNFNLGQCNLVVVFFTLAGLALLKKGRPITGGMTLSVGIALKLTPGLFLPYFLYKRQWKMAAGIVIGGLIFFFGLPVVVFGFQGALSELMDWREMLTAVALPAGSESTGNYVSGQSVRSFLTRLLSMSAIDNEPPFKYINILSLDPETVRILVYGAYGVMLGLMAWNFRRQTQSRTERLMLLEFAIVLLTMTMISPYSRKAHYVSMIFPAVVVVHYFLERGKEINAQRLTKVVIIATIVLVTLPFRGMLGRGVSDYVNGFGSIFVGALVMWGALNALLFRERSLCDTRASLPPQEERA